MEDRSFYVYAHYRLDTMEPFYIGKGKGNRKDIISRNHMHDRISKKHGHAVVILYDNLTEEESFFYEREVIEDLVFNEGYEISCKNCGEFTGKFSYLTNFTFGGEGVSGSNRFEDLEERQKISEMQKNVWKNPERRKKQSEKILSEKNGKARSVYCDTLNILFSCIKLAEKYCKNVLNIKICSISSVCNGKLKSTGRLVDGTELTWKHVEDVEQEVLNKAEYIDNEKYEEIINEIKKCGIPFKLNYYAKSVYCRELNIIFSHTKLAKQYCKNILKCKANNISSVCNGKLKSNGRLYDGTKLTWKHVKDVNKEILDKAELIDSEKYEEIIKAKLNENK